MLLQMKFDPNNPETLDPETAIPILNLICEVETSERVGKYSLYARVEEYF